MLHHNLRFELLVEFERDGHDDEQTCCRERVCKRKCRCCPRAFAHSERSEQECRDKGQAHKEHSTEEGDSVVYLFEEVACRFARSYAGDKSAVLLNVFGYVFGIELDLSVEITKSENEQCQEDVVDCGAASHISRIPSRSRCVAEKELDDHLREHKQGRCENDGHNATTVDANGDIRRLTAVHLVALDLFRVLHRDSSLCAVHKDDEHEYHDHQSDEAEDVPDICPFVADEFEGFRHSRACSRKDTDEDDD